MQASPLTAFPGRKSWSGAGAQQCRAGLTATRSRRPRAPKKPSRGREGQTAAALRLLGQGRIDGQDRAGRGTHHFVAHAPKNGPLKAFATVGSHDD